MPFIDSKVTVSIPDSKMDTIKAELGAAISIFGKPESFLMIGFDDEYDLYMGGKKLDKGAYVSVSLFGNGKSSAYEEMTARICQLYESELGIPANNIYVTYHGINDWGWNGKNF